MKQIIVIGKIITGLAVLQHITATINLVTARVKKIADTLEKIDNSLIEDYFDK